MQTLKRKRHHPPLNKVADGHRLIKKLTLEPAYLVKDDTIDITVNNRPVNAIVVMNDPFNHKIQVTNILANRQELMEVTYDEIETMAATVAQPKAQQTVNRFAPKQTVKRVASQKTSHKQKLKIFKEKSQLLAYISLHCQRLSLLPGLLICKKLPSVFLVMQL